MPALTAPALALAALLALAGAQKVLDPTMTSGALRALRLPSSPWLVRAGAAAELALGVAAIAVGGPVLWGLVAASFLAFAAFVGAALRSGTMIGSCGCFGREETPPHPGHVVLNVLLAGFAGAVAVVGGAAPAAAVADAPALDAVAVVGLAGVAVWLLWALFVVAPRAATAGDWVRGRA